MSLLNITMQKQLMGPCWAYFVKKKLELKVLRERTGFLAN